MRLWDQRGSLTLVACATCGTLLVILWSTQQASGSRLIVPAKRVSAKVRENSIAWNEGHDKELDPEAALLWGHHVLRQFRQEDRATALANFDSLADGSGFPASDTLFLLGRAYDQGRRDIGITRDEAIARELYQRAADMGHAASQHALAALLAASGDAGVEVEAIVYDFFASLGGDPLAHAAMGYRYFYG